MGWEIGTETRCIYLVAGGSNAPNVLRLPFLVKLAATV